MCSEKAPSKLSSILSVTLGKDVGQKPRCPNQRDSLATTLFHENVPNPLTYHTPLPSHACDLVEKTGGLLNTHT